MSTVAPRPAASRERGRTGRRCSHALAVLCLAGSLACGEDAPTAPVVPPPAAPGTISIATVTTGFMKDDGYEVLVNGESRGTIGANDAVTVAELDPATYAVDLADVAANCTVEGASSIAVESSVTAEITLTVVCAPDAPVELKVLFDRERPDMDTGEIHECLFGLCSTNEGWDMYVYYSSATNPKSVIRQNQTQGLEIAHLPGVTLADLTEADVAAATFTTDFVADPFDVDRVILLRTDGGALYALGNPVEDVVRLGLTFDYVLIG